MDRPVDEKATSRAKKDCHEEDLPSLNPFVNLPNGNLIYETAMKCLEFKIENVEYWLAVQKNGGDESKVPKLRLPPSLLSSSAPEEPTRLHLDHNSRVLNINDLTEACLLLLLKQFPLVKCIAFRQVCKWWKQVIEDNILKKKRSIKFFCSESAVNFYCDEIKKRNLHRKDDFSLCDIDQGNNDLVCKDSRALLACSKLFPSLRRLTICHYDANFPVQSVLAECLQKMPQLEALVFFGLNSNGEVLPGNFWPTINYLWKLKELHFFDMTPFLGSNTITYDLGLPYDLWALERLTKFSLVDYPGSIGAALQFLGPYTRELLLENVDMKNKHLSLSLDANPELELSLTHLTIGNMKPDDFDYREFLAIIGNRMKNLTHLNILGYRDIRLEQVFTEIAKLHLLEELSIDVCWDSRNNLRNMDAAPLLPTVRRLYIKDGEAQMKAPFILLHFTRIFPIIEFLQLESSSDEVCQELFDADMFVRFPKLVTFDRISPRLSKIHRRSNIINKPKIKPFAGWYTSTVESSEDEDNDA